MAFIYDHLKCYNDVGTGIWDEVFKNGPSKIF